MKEKKHLNYEGRDLEAMTFAQNYHQWILDIFKPYVGKTLVEVGAGSGSVTDMLLQYKPKKLIAIEPSEEMYPQLEKLIGKNKNVYLYQSFFSNIARKIQQKHNPDTFIYVNVMEHILNDKSEIKLVYNTLQREGTLLIFVPALPFLLSRFDKKIGHYRRYTKTNLENLCIEAGFRIELSKYFDAPGIIPWLIKYKLLKSTGMSQRSIEIYDSNFIPAIRKVESKVPPLVGKNIILVARKV